MKNPGWIALSLLFTAACNNSSDSTKTVDSTDVKDKTNVYDSTASSNIADSNRRLDTSLIPNKMQDTGMKK
ncbi:MAG TPA: hypothetical protein VGI82_10795 [Chitinophagaceae bacterium]|jgi:hypothetical protein